MHHRRNICSMVPEATFFGKEFPSRALQLGAGVGRVVLSRSRWQGLGRHGIGKCTGEGGMEIAQEDLGRERLLLLAHGQEVGSMWAS